MTDHIFETAHQRADRALVESLAPGGEWRASDDYYVCSPLRTDNRIGSFHIHNPSGRWLYHDFASGDKGDIIELASRIWAVEPVEAARRIAGESAYTPQPTRARPGRPPAPQLVALAEDEAKQVYKKSVIQGIAAKMRNEVARGGNVVAWWWYKNEEGEVDGLDVRYERPDPVSGRMEKIVITYWYDGQSVRCSPAPVLIYGRDVLVRSSDALVIIHEGAKCAALAQAALPDFMHIAWSGGAQKAGKADWGCLRGRKVIIYPDYDQQRDKNTGELFPTWEQPGFKAAAAIKDRLKGVAASVVIRQPLAQAVEAYGAGSDIAEALRCCEDYKV